MVWIRRDGDLHDLRFDVQRLHRHPRSEHVRPSTKATRVARIGYENARYQGQARKEREKHQESRDEITEELSTKTETIVRTTNRSALNRNHENGSCGRLCGNEALS